VVMLGESPPSLFIRAGMMGFQFYSVVHIGGGEATLRESSFRVERICKSVVMVVAVVSDSSGGSVGNQLEGGTKAELRHREVWMTVKFQDFRFLQIRSILLQRSPQFGTTTSPLFPLLFSFH
jgi:hypothetical protein